MPAILNKFQKLPIAEWILVQKVKSGDKEAFGTLYQLYLEKIYRFIFFKVQQNTQLAEDLTEIAFVKAWSKIDLYKKEGGSFSSWLYAIARNTVIDHFRSVRQQIRLEETQIDHKQDMEDNIHKKLELERIREILQELTDEQAEIVVLKFIEGLSNKEIARIMGKKEDAIRALQYRALQELRKRLK